MQWHNVPLCSEHDKLVHQSCISDIQSLLGYVQISFWDSQEKSKSNLNLFYVEPEHCRGKFKLRYMDFIKSKLDYCTLVSHVHVYLGCFLVLKALFLLIIWWHLNVNDMKWIFYYKSSRIQINQIFPLVCREQIYTKHKTHLYSAWNP